MSRDYCYECNVFMTTKITHNFWIVFKLQASPGGTQFHGSAKTVSKDSALAKAVKYVLKRHFMLTQLAQCGACEAANGDRKRIMRRMIYLGNQYVVKRFLISGLNPPMPGS